MKAPKSISNSWFSAALLICTIGLMIMYFLPKPSYESSMLFANFYIALGLTGVFAIPSSLLNWLYDNRGYADSQQAWMKMPSSLMGRMGYILTGSIALWVLLLLAIGLGALVFFGLFALGQGAWSS